MTVFFRYILLSSVLACMGLQPIRLNAQEKQSDLIEDMLDSLCTLEGIIECQAPETQESGTAAIFTFSNEMISARMATRFSPIPFEMNDQVRKYIDLYALKRKELVKRVMGLSEIYFPMFEEVLDKEGLPLELKYLSIVESALNPVAVSRAGATGIWQFMYQTAKIYGMKITSYVDERRDPLKATYAMTRYFKDMYALYNDWLLSIAAYNCGPNNVNKAILRSGGKTNFWEISPFLPAETRGYVPAFLAVCYVMQFAAEHDLYPVPPRITYSDIDTVFINQGASLARIAGMLNMSYSELQFLNPSYKKGIIPSGYNGILRIPKSKMDEFIANFEGAQLRETPAPAPVLAAMNLKPDGQPADGYRFADVKVRKVHVVKRGETLKSIASRYGCPADEIRKNNKLHSHSLKAGRKLIVYPVVKKIVADPSFSKHESDSISTGFENVNDPAARSAKEIDEQDTLLKVIYHTVEKGDTLWNIAKRYEATVEKIMQVNKLSNPDELQLGRKIKIPVGG